MVETDVFHVEKMNPIYVNREEQPILPRYFFAYSRKPVWAGNNGASAFAPSLATQSLSSNVNTTQVKNPVLSHDTPRASSVRKSSVTSVVHL